MAGKSPRQFHSQWSDVALLAQLPNIVGSPNQDPSVEVGDLCYVAGDNVYVCPDATLGAATWSGAAIIFYGGFPLYSDEFTEDLRFPAQGINPPGAPSDPDRDNTDGTLLFDAGRTEIVAGVAQLPHAWKEGDDIEPHVHWCPTTTDTGDVLWRLTYSIADVGEVFPASSAKFRWGAAPGTAETHVLSSFGDVTMTGKTISTIMKWTLSRIGGDAVDTYPADARLLEFDIHYQVDRPGSRQRYVK
jgi:hypothetical protein